jgi:hypothetical protein
VLLGKLTAILAVKRNPGVGAWINPFWDIQIVIKKEKEKKLGGMSTLCQHVNRHNLGG